tara:strand:+ start:22900 stop:24927 length:2028 start_codon:yes stop_codon:yes gene_type:complete
MANYIIQTVAFQVFFLLIYDVFLKKETFFNWNRLYLLATALLSVILPFIKIESFKEVVPQQYIIALPEIVLGQTASPTNTSVLLNAIAIENGNGFSFLELIFYIGTIVAALFFIFKLLKLLVLIIKNPKTYIGKLTLVKLINSNAAFSFFQYVFLGEFLNKEEKEAILKHELIHVKQRHTLDLLFFEVFRILFWFNPLVYMYQNRITTLHEFIADAEAVKQDNKSNYYQNLLAQIFETKKISFINPFFKESLIKKRIVMLQKSKSKQIHLFKYVLLIPMLFGMLVYSSCIENTDVKDSSYNIDKEVLKETPLIKKIKDVKHQIEIQGNLSDNEEKGLILLLNIVKGEAFNQELVNEVHNYTSQTSKSELTEMISEVFEQIQIQGNLNEEEDKELKKLLVLTNDDAFDDPYFADIIKFVDIPFGVIEQPPVFPGCEDLSNDEQRDCMAKNISNHVNSNFNIKLADSLKLTGRQRINVIFKIDTEGNIVDVRSRAPHPGLEEEAIRVIKTLPKMIPGEHKGKKVNVPYSLPIIFQVAEDDNNKKVENLEQDILLDIPFAVVEQPPVFPGCKDLSVKEQKDCFSMSITEFVNKNFKTKLANELKLTGRQRINVIFKIDTNGNVEYVKARAPHPGLEEEAIRVIKTLPKMIPGEHKGKKVNVPYSLPIIFQVAEKKVND